MLETLDYTIRIGSIPTFLYFDLYLYSAYAAHFVYIFTIRCQRKKLWKLLQCIWKLLRCIWNYYYGAFETTITVHLKVITLQPLAVSSEHKYFIFYYAGVHAL